MGAPASGNCTLSNLNTTSKKKSELWKKNHLPGELCALVYDSIYLSQGSKNATDDVSHKTQHLLNSVEIAHLNLRCSCFFSKTGHNFIRFELIL